MKKRISALVLSSCLLAGCAGQGAAATGETAAPSQAVPTAAPQSLTVNGLLDTSAAVGALELYAQAQNVTLQNSFETETADLVILDAPPQDDGTWKNLAENELLAAAAQRAGLDTESTVTALPVGQSLYAYWADNRVLTELLQSDAALDDLRAATWEEWFDFVTAVTHWCAEPGAVQVTLNGNAYTLPAERRETPSQAVPTAAPQSLTVNGLLDTSAAVGALELYAQAQNVTLQNSFETETADLVILDAPPQDDGTWKNLAENELLAAAAQRAGLDTESTVTALPVGQSLYAYWADNRVLTELLQSDAALDDLRAATWEEWFDFVTAVTHWCAEPGAVQVTLNGNAYTLPAERRETLANLNGVFAAQGPEVSGNSGDGGVAENTPALYTTALLAAGEPLTEENLTGPLNALEQELRLEDANSAWQAGIADLWTSKYLFQQGNALFYRGYLADLVSDSGAALSSAQKDALVWLPIKNNLTEADIANQRFNLAGLMNYPILANRAWLAIPADADEESARAAAAAILWLYTSKAGESALIDTLDLITPWGTGSNQNAAAAMQAAQVTAGILPGAALDQTQAAALQQAQRGLYYEADGITLRDGLWDEDAAAAWRSAVMAALGAESAEADDN